MFLFVKIGRYILQLLNFKDSLATFQKVNEFKYEFKYTTIYYNSVNNQYFY